MTGARTTGGLLAVHAHPDDETLSTGALLAAWAASGRPVTVVTCTRGERGEVIPSELAHLEGDLDGLARHREGELAAALAALGVADHVYLDRVRGVRGVREVRGGDARYVDSGMVWVRPGQAGPAPDAGPDAFARVPVEDAARDLASVIRARRPDVVVGYEPGGGYGHPDHVHAHRVLHAALAAAPDGPQGYVVPVVLWAAVADDDLRAGRRALAGRDVDGARPEAVDAPVASAVVPASAVAVRVAVGPVLGALTAAMAAHRTQVHAIRTWPEAAGAVGCFALSNDVLQPILPTESYVRAARADAPGDLTAIAWPAGVVGPIA